MAFMYRDDDERKFINDVFLQVAIVDEVIVVFKSKYSNSDQIIAKENKSEFKIAYGSVIDSCHQSFYAEKNNFVLKDGYCLFDLITE